MGADGTAAFASILPFALVALVILVRAVVLLRRGEAGRVMISSIALVVYIVGLWVPAQLQQAGVTRSKLETAALATAPTDAEVAVLTGSWGIELAVVLVAELVAAAVIGRRRARGWTEKPAERLQLAIALLVIGVVAFAVAPPETFAERASGGNGVEVLMRTFLIVGVSYVAYHFGFGRKHFALAVLFGVCFLAVGGVRSPLVVIAVGALFGYLRLARASIPIKVALICAVSALAAVVSAVMSAARSSAGVPLARIVEEVVADPVSRSFGAGLDTLDGYRLVALVNDSVPSRIEDIFLSVTTFVPRAVWPGKPTPIGNEISSQYLGYPGGTQFLSGPGYLNLISPNRAVAMLLLALVVFLLAMASVYVSNTFGIVIVTVTAGRFFVSGSAFDLYYGLTLALCLALGVVFLVFWRLFRRQPVRRHTQSDSPITRRRFN